MQRRIMIVDDNEMNRDMLREMLHREYDIIEADDGIEALRLMEHASESISAVLLDILMPRMDGYEVLAHMRGSETMSQIPVIVTTGNTEEGAEVKALALGANDFITKPYNPEIIRHRLSNTISLREKAAIINATKTDALTGLYSRAAFFEIVEEMVSKHEPGYYVMACFDIDKFKVINDQYGSAKGDEVLKYIADAFLEGFGQSGGVCCRIMADNYAILYPRSFMESEEIEEIRRKAETLDGSIPPITFSIGRYIVDDIKLSPSAMYDRASMAKTSIKGRFDVHIAIYDESMRNLMLREQEIIGEMRQALENRQFEVWFQPQYNHATKALVGAEALVRWRHPDRGLISPGIFIPIFEKNGFIYEMDKYVWEQTCIALKHWTEAGFELLPISVNISRYDIHRDDLIEVISGLVSRYDIPVSMLRLEITESVFSQSSDRIIYVVREFQRLGFTMEIDDFGSGYSSLNTLKDVPADVVKLDMRFLEGDGQTGRGGNILESIVRMTRWLGMSVIAEGVETIEQADFLKSIGCIYVQGYLYAKPMLLEDYENLLMNEGKEDKMLSLETVENLDNNTFWDPKSIETLIFNSFVGGASVFEYNQGKIEMLRINDKYAKVLGGENMSVEEALQVDWQDYTDGDYRDRTKEVVRKAIATNCEVSDEIKLEGLRENGRPTYVRSTIRVIARADDRYLLYAMMEDITEQKVAEEESRMHAEETKRRYEHELQLRHELINDSIIYYELNITSGIIEEFLSKYTDIPSMRSAIPINVRIRAEILENIAEEDKSLVERTLFSEGLLEAYERDENQIEIEYRRNLPGRGMCWVKTNVTIVRRPDTEELVALIYVRDIDREKKNQIAIETIMNEEIESVVILQVSDGTAHLVHANHNLSSISLNQTFDFAETFRQLNQTMVLEKDVGECNRFFCLEGLLQALAKEKICRINYRVKEQDNICRKTTRAYYLDDSQREIVLIRQDITDLYEEEQHQKRILQRAVKEANEANHAKSDFLSNMSHDMRTPLNAVLAFSNEEITDQATEEQLRDYLDKIHVSGDYLLGIINDVLDMSKIEQKKVTLNPEPYSFEEFTKTIENVIGEHCRNKKITFHMDCSNTEIYTIMVDKIRFNQIFINLLSNAVKFTPQNGRVELLVDDAPKESWPNVSDDVAVKRFVVKDNGIGMSSEFLPHAFESFKQEFRKDISENNKGTGLGLAIVKELVNLMKGKISVESESGKGTTFVVDIPLEIVRDEAAILETKKIHEQSLQGMHILLGEDNIINTEIAMVLLEKQGCIVDAEDNGKKALERFQASAEGYYDVILMDIRMPVMNGLEAAKAIRTTGRKDAKSIPIIAMTADAFSEDEQTAKDAGMSNYISKPIEPQILFGLLKKYYVTPRENEIHS